MIYSKHYNFVSRKPDLRKHLNSHNKNVYIYINQVNGFVVAGRKLNYANSHWNYEFHLALLYVLEQIQANKPPRRRNFTIATYFHKLHSNKKNQTTSGKWKYL